MLARKILVNNLNNRILQNSFTMPFPRNWYHHNAFANWQHYLRIDTLTQYHCVFLVSLPHPAIHNCSKWTFLPKSLFFQRTHFDIWESYQYPLHINANLQLYSSRKEDLFVYDASLGCLLLAGKTVKNELIEITEWRDKWWCRTLK